MLLVDTYCRPPLRQPHGVAHTYIITKEESSIPSTVSSMYDSLDHVLNIAII